MAKFKVTWLATGVEEIVNQADRDTVQGYIDSRFGFNYDPKKAKVELVVDEPLEEEPAIKPKKFK
jgi:hypothetical protein